MVLFIAEGAKDGKFISLFVVHEYNTFTHLGRENRGRTRRALRFASTIA